MKFGLKKEQFEFIMQEVVIPLTNSGAKVWCYGSRARGDHKQFSDLDIMVESELDLSRQISMLKEKMSNSNFPYKVDLVEYKYFADSYKKLYEKEKVQFS